MGIDPGVANTGFGVVRVAGSQMIAVDGGVIEAPAAQTKTIRDTAPKPKLSDRPPGIPKDNR